WHQWSATWDRDQDHGHIKAARSSPALKPTYKPDPAERNLSALASASPREVCTSASSIQQEHPEPASSI
ncbi:MAG: hypothetical protein M1815_004932, partial [Lichina confinis]